MTRVRSSDFRPDIEGLRGLAVLLVVAYHSGLPVISGGFIGVDVFFVISGYVITALIRNEIQRTGKFKWIAFYARRARRLIPAATLTMATTIAVAMAILSPYELKEVSKAAFTAILFSSNIWFAIQASDYFAPDADTNPVLHTWSLGVEEQFYLFWPVLIFLAVRRGAPLGRQVAILAAVSAIAFVGCVIVTNHQQPLAFYSMPTRAWQFGVGALALLLPEPRGGFRRWGSIASWLGFAIIAIASVTITRDSPFPGFLALAPTLGTVLVLYAGRSSALAGIGGFLATAPMQLVGKLSYSWYLWHWPALVFAHVIFSAPSGLQILAADACSFALAAMSHRLVENPIRFNRYLVQRQFASLGLAAVLVSGAALCAYGSYVLSKVAFDAPRQRAIASAATIKPKYWDCILKMTRGASELSECVFGNPNASRTIVLFGDSHAWQWIPAFEEIADAQGFRLVALARSSCPVAAIQVFNRILNRDYVECEMWRTLALRRIHELHPTLVVVGTYYGYVDDVWERWMAAARATYERLRADGFPLVLMRDNPAPGRDPLACLSRADWHGVPPSVCVFPRSRGLDTKTYEAEKAAVAGMSDTHFIDLSDKICPTESCLMEANGEIVYRDNNHLTEDYVRKLIPALAQKLLPLIPPQKVTGSMPR